MIRITTPSRLHFGLLAPRTEQGRVSGGAGLMIQEPAFKITMRPHSEWQVRGKGAERAEKVLQRLLVHPLARHHGLSPQAFELEQNVHEHLGLGSGTQLSLAMARLLWASVSRAEPRLIDLVQWTGRGLRSAIGAYGFEGGGLVVEAGKVQGSAHLSPLVSHVAFPANWRVLLCLPTAASDWAEEKERRAFERLPRLDPSPTPRLCQLLLQGIIPAVMESDFDAFADALDEYNRRAGEWYRETQGGDFASPSIAQAIGWLHDAGVRGAIQSSWGPTAAGFAASEEGAQEVKTKLESKMAQLGYVLMLTRAANHGALLESC